MNSEGKIRIEDLRKDELSEKEITAVGETYANFYKYKSYRSGALKHFQNKSFEDALSLSRQLFWNSMTTQSEDLENLGLNFSLPFARKEVLDFLGRLVSLNISPKIGGDELDATGIRMLQAMYKHWEFKSNQKVERFWEILYGLTNGTVCSYVGFNNSKLHRRYLESYDTKTGDFKITTKEQAPWNDVSKEIVAIEDIYIPKIYERNVQKQGNLIWKQQMDESTFHAKYDSLYENAKYVYPGNRIAEDSLYFRLLGGSGSTAYNKIELMHDYNWITDEYRLIANGILLNKLGKSKTNVAIAPMPFDHKMAPFTWGIMSPIDEKFAYGMMMPFQIKDPQKILNTSYTMMVERELRAIDPPILTSDIESPELIFGQHKVIPVNDVDAYKEMNISEPSNQFFNMLNSLQSNASAISQGGDTSIIPSRQPKSAREVMDINAMKQQAMANSVTMYYDIIRQEVMLVLKTMLQFYQTSQIKNSDKRIIRSLTAGEMPLSSGGIGNVNIRFVKEKKDGMELFIEAIKKKIADGKNTEIIEVPIEFIQDLDFTISSIELKPDSSSEIEMMNYVENVINPMLNVYIPAGIADMGKTFLRHVEKMGENPADFIAESKPVVEGAGGQNPGGQTDRSAFAGNMQQSMQGIKFGGQKNQGLPV